MSISNMNEKQPFISVCIPTYNRANYLGRCIESIIGYSEEYIEIVIQDNCSADGTREVVKQFNDKRIKYFRNETNIGLFNNVVQVIKNAIGKYVYLLTDDDILLAGALNTIVNILGRNEISALRTNFISYMEQRKGVHFVKVFEEDRFIKEGEYTEAAKILISANVLTGICIKREIIDFNFLNELNETWYPSYVLFGTAKLNIGYTPEPSAIHTWENKTFWGIEPQEINKLQKGMSTIFISLFTSKKINYNYFLEIIKEYIFKRQGDFSPFLPYLTKRDKMSLLWKYRWYKITRWGKCFIKKVFNIR